MLISKKWSTKTLIRLHGCAGLSAPVLFANPWRQVFSHRGPLSGDFWVTFWGWLRKFYYYLFLLTDIPEMCLRRPTEGDCENMENRWHFNADTKECEKIPEGYCCDINGNNFADEETCRSYCGKFNNFTVQWQIQRGFRLNPPTPLF